MSSTHHRKIILQAIKHLGILMAAVVLGFLVRSVVVGQLLVVLYAILAFVFKVESRTTFLLALMSLGVVLISSVRSDTLLASAFAVYAFLLLVVGTISLGREVRDEL